ncbi:MAG: MarR family transcriptional regulator, partial [Acidobacteria bacterium]|nr:MarR family transcriptional regulator [Acidobacteriota bacterium]
GQYLISGFRCRDLRSCFPDRSPGWLSRSLKRLRVHGIIRRVGRTYKYYLTAWGKRIIATGLSLKELFLVPRLAVDSKR